MRINQLHWSDNIQPVCRHVFAWIHVCNCVRVCVPACTSFYANWKISDCVQLKCFLSVLPLCSPWSPQCWQQQQQRKSFSHTMTFTVVDFFGRRFWSWLFFCRVGNFSAQPYAHTSNGRYTHAIIRANTQNTNRYTLADAFYTSCFSKVRRRKRLTQAEK